MAFPFSADSLPIAIFAIAAAHLTIAVLSMKTRCGRMPEIGKFSTARAVCAP